MILGGARGTVLFLASVLTTTVAQTLCGTTAPVFVGPNGYALQPNEFSLPATCGGGIVYDAKVFVFTPPRTDRYTFSLCKLRERGINETCTSPEGKCNPVLIDLFLFLPQQTQSRQADPLEQIG